MSFNENFEIDYNYTQDFNYDDYDKSLELHKNNSYLILKEDQLLSERDKIINEAIEFLSLERNQAILVLINYSWSIDNIRDNWYEDVEKNMIRCGLSVTEKEKEQLIKNSIRTNNNTCLVCDWPRDDTFDSLECNHFFCGDCWTDYLSVKSDDLLACFSTTCPQKGCSLVVRESYFFKYIKSSLQKEKFCKAILKNFTNYNSDLKICPSPTCNICVKCETHVAKEITCVCGTVFCFKCWKESHRPCSCELVQRWEIRSKSDTENDKWVKANTKQCPHCKQRIEKSQGCNYMSCNKAAGGCGKAFCYVCEIDWEKHSQDHFKCNMYTPQVQEKENEASKLKAELERYKFYFDRYMNYNSAVKFAENLKPALTNIIDTLINIKLLPLSELQFLNKSLETVINAKRTLKYTYIFGFYLKDGNEKKLFEYSQAFLERNADNLHQLIEQDSLNKMVSEENYETFNRQFIDFKNTLVNLCFATVKYQKNLLNEIETTMLHLLDEKL